MPDHQHEFDPRGQREALERFEPEPLPPLARAAKRYILALHFGFAAFAVAACWVIYLLDLYHTTSSLNPADIAAERRAMFWLTVGITVAACLIAPAMVYRALSFARHGQETLGVVTGFARSSLHPHSLARVDYAYEYDGKLYKKANSTHESYSSGDPIRIVIDPKRPKRCALRSTLFPADDQEKAKHKDAERQAAKWWWAWLVIGSLFLASSLALLLFVPADWRPAPPDDGQQDLVDVLFRDFGTRGVAIVVALVGVLGVAVGLRERNLHRRSPHHPTS